MSDRLPARGSLPAREPEYIDAEWRDVGEREDLEAKGLLVACPHCGHDACPAFGRCYFCYRSLQLDPIDRLAAKLERWADRVEAFNRRIGLR